MDYPEDIAREATATTLGMVMVLLVFAWAMPAVTFQNIVDFFQEFTQDEIRRYYEEGGFVIKLLEQRNPYDFEIAAERIFAIGKKA